MARQTMVKVNSKNDRGFNMDIDGIVGTENLAIVPVLTRKGEVIAVLLVGNSDKAAEFTPENINLLEKFAESLSRYLLRSR